MMWESFQEEEQQQRMIVERHMSEGVELVEAAKKKKEEEDENIFNKSFHFVQKDKEASAILLLQRVVRLVSLAKKAKARVRARREALKPADATPAAAATTTADPANNRPDSGAKVTEGPKTTLPSAAQKRNAPVPPNAGPPSSKGPQARKRVGLPNIANKNVPPPPAGKPQKGKPTAGKEQLSKLEIRQRLQNLNKRRQKLIRSLARALKTEGSDLHQLQRNLKDVSIEIQKLLQLQSR